MQLSRRKFLMAAAATGAAAGLGFIASSKPKDYWLVSACSDRDGHFVAAVDLHGRLINKIAIPSRGHSVIAMAGKPGHGMIFARRPGMFALEVDFVNGRIVHEIKPDPGSHFYGHGAYVQKDNILLTSENSYHSGEGKIVVRDGDSYKILAEYSSGGIGPHEIALMPNESSIVIANGGIKTHPDKPREKLNLDSMKPNLAYLDLASGEITERVELANHKLSIRHLAVSQQGKVIAGLQYQGVKTDLVPLAISHERNRQAEYLKASEQVWRSMNQYTASVCVDNEGQIVAISCPRADKITYWSLANNSYLGSERIADGAGLTFIDQLYVSSGKGRVQALSPNGQLASRFEQLRWDNHLSYISGV